MCIIFTSNFRPSLASNFRRGAAGRPWSCDRPSGDVGRTRGPIDWKGEKLPMADCCLVRFVCRACTPDSWTSRHLGRQIPACTM